MPNAELLMKITTDYVPVKIGDGYAIVAILELPNEKIGSPVLNDDGSLYTTGTLDECRQDIEKIYRHRAG